MKRLDELLTRGAPDAVGLVQGDRQLSYAELDVQVSAVAAAYAACGVEAGDRVAVYSGKTIEAVAAMFAVARAGAVLVPINPVLKAAQVAHILADSGAKLLVTQRARADQLIAAEALGETALLVIENDWPTDTGHPPLTPAGPDDLAAILYTSGSTGRPKGVMLSHRNLLVGAESVASYIGNRADDRILSVLPLSFDAGFSQLTTGFHAGARVVLLDYLLPRDVMKAVARHGITGLTGVPPLWIQLAEIEWPEGAGSTLRYLANTGGRMPVPVTRRLRALFPDAKLFLMYGLTEAFRSTYLDPALADAHPESIGGAIPNAEVMVVAPDGGEAAPDQPGELVHAGPLVAQGYWRDLARTAERFRPAPAFSKLGGTAAWSGDTVRRDAAGLLYFVGRDDEMIKSSGNRVSPTEIEEAAYATGAVAEAVALGVADERLGQVVLLIASPAGGRSSEEAEATLRGAMAAAVPGYMLPKRIVWLTNLPRNANGKLDRVMLRREHGG
ncbi:acyl-CoA ligase (AMP-forming), exosortase A system-associated [Sphingoaurantiacus capsulatus]|uniref:Acyl-CoA ligase (AMP-forming), exosortase A system-associated n=1 Tax=Sphingoaurantiacus capsulatus TaxID=1771310 RepID=A0ABV7XGK4_9SPHN